MRMLNKIIFIGCLMFAANVSFSQTYENDGKGISFKQLYGCQDTAGVKLDSMFRMTDTTGKLTICISIQDLIDIINNYGGDGGGGGGGFNCDSVGDCLTGGVLCEVLGTFGNESYGTGDKLVGVNQSNNCRLYDLNLITGVGDTVRLVNNADGSYTLINENGTNFQYGYMLNCINDSTFALTDWDGTPVDTCVIKGGINGSIPPLNCDSVAACVNTFLCDSVLACLNEGILCEALNLLEDANTEAGQKYVTILPNGDCVLTDSIYIDICGILQEIQEESELMEDDIAFILRGENCFKVEISTRATNCIDVSIDAGDIIASPIMDPVPPPGFTKLYCGSEGMYGEAVMLDFNCDSLNALFSPASTADSIYADNGGECVKIPFPGAATVNCDTIASIFSAGGTLDAGDFILTLNTGTGSCQRVSGSNFITDCEDMRQIFNSGTSDPDSILAFKEGSCVRVASSEFFNCGSLPAPWDGDCTPAYVMLMCDPGGGGGGLECRSVEVCDFKLYLDTNCFGMRAPYMPSEMNAGRPLSKDEIQRNERQFKEEIKKEITKQLSFVPSALTERAAQTDYPTVDNMGIRTFKSKRQAELSEIPIGGIYYIEGKGNMYVKTRQRNK